jgi:hypothetical protein
MKTLLFAAALLLTALSSPAQDLVTENARLLAVQEKVLAANAAIAAQKAALELKVATLEAQLQAWQENAAQWQAYAATLIPNAPYTPTQTYQPYQSQAQPARATVQTFHQGIPGTWISGDGKTTVSQGIPGTAIIHTRP